MYCFLHPEDYGSNVGATNKGKEEDDEEDEEGEDNEEEQEDQKITKTRSLRTPKMRKGTPCNSFMPLPLNFLEKSPGKEVSSNSGLNYWSQ